MDYDFKRRFFQSKAVSLFTKGRYRSAATAFKRMLAGDKRSALALSYLGFCLDELGKTKQALLCWQECKRLDPTLESTHLNLGYAYEKLNRSPLAIRNYKKEIEINPTSAKAFYNLGNLYFRLHKYKKAADYLEKCYALKHSVEHIIDRLAYSYFRTGRIEKEIALYQDWLQVHPKDTWCLNNFGAALMQAGEYNRAQLQLRKAMALDPSDKTALKNLERVQTIRKKLRDQISTAI